MAPLITVINIISISFTGTSWLNAVLGCHERCFAVGPPDRAWDLRNQGWDDVCLIHGDSCSFWPAFTKHYEPDKNFFIQLAEYSGKDVIVINNPNPAEAGTQVSHPDILEKRIHLVRDGRAISASYARKYPDVGFVNGVIDWLRPALEIFQYDPDDPDCLSLRYEDVVADNVSALEMISRFVDVSYSEDALNFWDWDLHLTAANTGIIDLIMRGQSGKGVNGFKDSDFYAERFRQMQATGDNKFVDCRWENEISRRERFIFDLVCGVYNAQYGYERDRFNLSEVSEFSRELLDAIRQPDCGLSESGKAAAAEALRALAPGAP